MAERQVPGHLCAHSGQPWSDSRCGPYFCGNNHIASHGACQKRTFADSLHGAHLGAIFHGVEGEVNLGERLLLLEGADGIFEVLGLVNFAWLLVLHGGQMFMASLGGASRRMGEEGTRGEWGASSDPVVAAGETGAEAPLGVGLEQENTRGHADAGSVDKNGAVVSSLYWPSRARRRGGWSCRAEKLGVELEGITTAWHDLTRLSPMRKAQRLKV